MFGIHRGVNVQIQLLCLRSGMKTDLYFQNFRSSFRAAPSKHLILSSSLRNCVQGPILGRVTDTTASFLLEDWILFLDREMAKHSIGPGGR